MTSDACNIIPSFSDILAYFVLLGKPSESSKGTVVSGELLFIIYRNMNLCYIFFTVVKIIGSFV